MAIIGNGVARASTLLAAAGNLTSSSQETTTYPKPHTLWLQNIAIALEVIMPAISLIVCSLRAYIRFSTKYLGWDDFWIFSAMFLCMPQAATAVQYIKEGYIGIHNREIPPHDPTEANILNFINGLLYNPILSMVKISVLTFLLRLASTKPAVRVTVWILMIFTACMMIVIFFCVIFVCHPIAANWDKTIKAHCFNRNTFSMWTASVNLLTDFLTLAIPFWIFLGLRMARKVKIALLCVFAMGFSTGFELQHWLYHAGDGDQPRDHLGIRTRPLAARSALVP
ncbi:hypothetical protein VTK73DRAFT_1097 [Phialemonium thermophilum]|uniref:Rhodopsin domain-containing protein n=1 Tax=Phialemonium thermophilum TaxID=223376 RepID=A0ABR3VTW5_9PEZI